MKRHLILACGLMAASGIIGTAGEKTDVSKELARFQGTWVPVSAETNGQEAPKEALAGISITISKDTLTVKQNDKEVMTGTLKVDPSKTPREYDASSSAQGKKLSTIGIYEITSDTLKVCYTPEGGKRPRQFSTKDGTDEHPVLLRVYKRQAEKKDK
jgi:uncharacterized protein (TIGR03067 family)